jgi:2',3'-cyclic-nucleotide 2'-phosphodiesterase/3'-nucleotidase
MKTWINPLVLTSSLALLLSGCNLKLDSNNKDASDADSKLLGSASVKLRVMETTDLHANILNFNYYNNKSDDSVGLVKTASLIEKSRQEVDNSVLVDNGDLLQGSPLGDYYAKVKGLGENDVHPIYKAMNLLQYDAANIGNHEFNFGLTFLKEAIDDANFPYISSNIVIDDNDTNEENDVPYFSPFMIQQKNVIDIDGNTHSLTIGYIGFVPPQVMQWDKANLETHVKAKDMVEMANYYVPIMKDEGADIIIAIPHSGLVTSERLGNDENASYYLAQVPGIDAIMFGHAHRNFPGDASYDGLPNIDNEKGTINGVAAVMPGYWGKYLGVIDLELEKNAKGIWSVADSQSSLRAISKANSDRTVTSLVESHPGIKEAVHADHLEVQGWVSAPFAKISAPINSFFALVQDDPSIQVVTDAQAWYVKDIVKGTELEGLPILSVGAPFRAGRGGSDDFTDLAKGDVSYGNVSDLYIYPNTLKVLQLSGAQVKEWLEMSAGQFNQIVAGTVDQPLVNADFPSYNFDVIDGIEYQIDVSQKARYDKDGALVEADSERIVQLNYQGKALDLTQQFLVVSNNYRASGGGNFPEISSDKIVIDAPNENRQTVADYLINQTQLNPDNGFDPSANGNWHFAPLSNTQVLFNGSSKASAQAFAQTLDSIEYVKVNDDGYGVYRLSL